MNVCRASILSVTVCVATPTLAALTVNSGGSEARAALILQPVPGATGAAPNPPRAWRFRPCSWASCCAMTEGPIERSI